MKIPGEARGDLLVSVDIRVPPAGDGELLAVLEGLQSCAALPSIQG